MKRMGLMLALLAVVTTTHSQAQPPYIGDYDAELRDGDHVNCELMVRRLQELGANTYMWLIWHSPNDWEDLQEFLPLAAEANITVWVYLVPPSETAAVHASFPYSEPFRLDYVRWAEEIARLSLEHKNLVGYVIDDFWGNVLSKAYTPEYIEQMVAAGRAINPEIKFYPLMYFPQIGPRFMKMFGTIVDGVVVAYPRNPEAVERILPYLRGEFVAPPEGSINYPYHTSSQAGDHGFLQQTVRVVDADAASLTFSYRDDFNGPTAGYHFMQVRVDDEVVWEEDVEGRDEGEVTLDLSEYVAGHDEVTISLGIFDHKGVGNFGVFVTFSDLKAEGLELQPLDAPDAWQEDVQGEFVTAASPPYEPPEEINLPLILMPSGSAGAYEKRNGEEGTPERIGAKYAMCLQFVREGKAEGVVSYCLDKSEDSESFEAVRQVIAEFWRETRAAEE